MQAGQYITDGTVRWLVVDIRDGSMVGDITYSPILRAGHVKANGALLASASVNYPRLVDFVQDNPSLLAADDTAWADNKALYVYDDTNDTLRVPDATGRVLQGGDVAESREAGLPNIKGAEGTAIAVYKGSSGAINILPPFYRPQGDIGSGTNLSISSGGGIYPIDLSFDASLSNPIYSASQTVQPPALTQIAQIKY